MKRPCAALAASLACTAALAALASWGQQPAGRAAAPPAPPARAAAGPATPPATAARASAARPVPVYRVELVVFRANAALGSPEDWAAESGAGLATSTDADPDASGSSPAAGADSAPGSGVRLLPASEFQLDDVAARLRASGRYVPVAHIAWAQTASPWAKPIRIPVQSVGLDVQGITGSVALERGQFLHLALDLRYAMDDPPPGLDAPAGTVFVLDDSHRVRLRERNYFDHPAFGVIALVTPDATPRR